MDEETIKVLKLMGEKYEKYYCEKNSAESGFELQRKERVLHALKQSGVLQEMLYQFLRTTMLSLNKKLWKLKSCLQSNQPLKSYFG